MEVVADGAEDGTVRKCLRCSADNCHSHAGGKSCHELPNLVAFVRHFLVLWNKQRSWCMKAHGSAKATGDCRDNQADTLR